MNGVPVEGLSVDRKEPYSADFAGRGEPSPGRSDADLVVFRRRRVGRGMCTESPTPPTASSGCRSRSPADATVDCPSCSPASPKEFGASAAYRARARPRRGRPRHCCDCGPCSASTRGGAVGPARPAGLARQNAGRRDRRSRLAGHHHRRMWRRVGRRGRRAARVAHGRRDTAAPVAYFVCGGVRSAATPCPGGAGWSAPRLRRERGATARRRGNRRSPSRRPRSVHQGPR